MIPNNYYPVKYEKFLRLKSIGNYVVMYAILDDRVHFEMAIENAVYITQKFFIDIEEEISKKAENYENDKVDIFLRMSLGNTTFYRYYPTDEVLRELKKIKLYDKIKVTEVKNGSYDPESIKIFESDTYMKAMDGDEVVLFGEKQ